MVTTEYRRILVTLVIIIAMLFIVYTNVTAPSDVIYIDETMMLTSNDK
ncbi:hypothetical protein [Staphylococcus equorum]|nr:hypothetical protein [Staphylococcus equorum]